MNRAAFWLFALPLTVGPACADPAPLWHGLYFGLGGGYGGGVAGDRRVEANPPLPFLTAVDWSHGTSRASGFLLGGQVGYNWRLDNQIVLGVETDAQWSDIGRAAHDGAAQFPVLSQSVDSQWARLDWFGATRLRAGYAIGRLLPYVTAGVAYGGLSTGSSGVVQNGAGLYRIARNESAETRVGWTLGAGAEYALTRNLSAKTEYLYTEFGAVDAPTATFYPASNLPPFVWPASMGKGVASAGRLGLHVIRAGLNYNFSAGGDLLGASFATPEVAPHDWSGFYAGVNGGYGGGVIGQDEWSVVSFPALATTTGTQTARAGGFVAGGQAGFNRQFANGLVLGVETDAQWSGVGWSNMRARDALSAAPVSPIFDPRNGVGGELSWFGATRARLGFGFDRVLPFVTGGVAYGGVSARSTASQVWHAGVTLVDLYDAGAASVRAGWTIGGGMEFAVTNSLSFKTQYDYLELGGVGGAGVGVETAGVAINGAGAPVPLNTPRVGALSTGALGFHIVRAGVNWRFDPTP